MFSVKNSQDELSSFLIKSGLISNLISEQAIESAKQQKITYISYLVQNKLLSSQCIFDFCKNFFGLTTFDLKKYDFKWLKNSNLTYGILKHAHAIPLNIDNEILHVGISDPTNRNGLDVFSFHSGKSIKPVLVLEDQLSELLDNISNHKLINNGLEFSLIDKINLEENLHLIQENTANYDEPLIRFVDNIILSSLNVSASDIHIEPYKEYCRIRYRKDGVLHELTEIPILLASRLISRLKILANLDISERRLPQDGRFHLHHHDFRINTCPTLFGEKVVLRILNASNNDFNIENLGMDENQKKLFIKKISQPQGLILVTGPTGSGKTLTLYSALNFLNTTEKNISTVEDPIEIQLHGINQINVQPKVGLEFSTILRTILRQDPDIIMIGEIRDRETAEIAIQAAQTGHLVFATLHTNSAVEAIVRLQSMNISIFNIANALSLIIGQRLIRKLCPYCKQTEVVSQNILSEFNIPPINSELFSAVGCEQCLNGYYKRVGLFELLPISAALSQLISSNATVHQLQQQADHENFISLKNTGIQLVIKGVTSLSELNRILSLA